MKAPIAYYGGKMGLSRRIVDLLPPHRTYLEPFFGSGAVLFAKPPAASEVVNDRDGALVCFFRMLRDRPEDLAEACRLSPYGRDEFEACAQLGPDLDDLERARRFWVRVNQSFGKTAGTATGWAVSTARSQSMPASVQARVDRFRACAARLAAVAIENCDGADLVARLATADTVVYADPPYLAETRRGRERHRPADYAHDMGAEEDHRRLAQVLRATPAAVVLSGYPSALYDELYAGWWRVEFPVLAHASNAVTAARGERVEVLWSNRDLDAGRLDFTAGPRMVDSGAL